MTNIYRYSNIAFVAVSTKRQEIDAIVVQLVARDLAKVELAGSSPVYRSKNKPCKNAYRVLFLLGYIFGNLGILFLLRVSGMKRRSEIN